MLASVGTLHVHRRHAVAAGVDHFLVLGTDIVVGGFVSDGLIDEGRIQADLLKQVPGNVGLVWAVAILVQCPTRSLVPRVEIIH